MLRAKKAIKDLFGFIIKKSNFYRSNSRLRGKIEAFNWEHQLVLLATEIHTKVIKNASVTPKSKLPPC